MNQEICEIFWSKVQRCDSSEGCWLWLAGRFGEGYGEIKVDGVDRYAHRVAWEITYGPIPHGMCVLHRCDNRACVNPSHLFLGTKADNSRDMALKDRGTIRFSKEEAARIRGLYLGGIKQAKLARMFDTSSSAIEYIVRRRGTYCSLACADVIESRMRALDQQTIQK